MIGALPSLVFCLLSVGLGHILLKRLTSRLDPATQLGLSGMVALASVGTLIYFLGIADLGLATMASTALVVVGGLVGWWSLIKARGLSISRPEGLAIVFPAAIGLAMVFAFAGVLAPSTSADWDSLAYHLAVPKLWLQDGRVSSIPFIHQSNFPFAIDSLFVLGLKWGGQSGAKAFVWAFTIFGLMAIFGIARQRHNVVAGWWATLLFVAIPIVVWQSGTAYIDVAHGLFAGLGIVFVCRWLESKDASDVWLGAIMIGFAAGTKYTGLQTLAVVGLVALVGALVGKVSVKPIVLMGLVALAIASPWYVKNAIWKGNPVFPFFYSVLGGNEWDERRAAIYTNEQNSFGVGRVAPPEGSISPLRLGHSILGMSYQPGRYVNPQQTLGGGDPMGAVGVGILSTLVLALAAGRGRRFENAMVACVLGSLAIWFVLTQQNRYIVALGPPLAVIGAGLTQRRGFGIVMTAAAGLQAVATLYLVFNLRFSDQMLVVTGKESAEEFQSRRIPFYRPAQEINRLGTGVKVALYDEVFGYVLDVPYYWANPGHSAQIPYDGMADAASFVEEMKKRGFTHAYLNLRAQDPKLGAELHQAMQGGAPSAETREMLMSNWQVKFNALIADAVSEGRMSVLQSYGNPQSPQPVLLKFN